MSFLSEYGLFLLKALTVLMVFLVAVTAVFVIRRREVSKVSVTSYNECFGETQETMRSAMQQKKAVKRTRQMKRAKKQRPILFLLDFCGDMRASEVQHLREAITAVLSVATPKDEVVVRLESPGGSVNGYGLAASQLQRIRDRHLSLTVCIDKVAASGGYLMACVANQIVAAPFAILGSIGVVAQLPNFHRFLKKHDVDVELLTAGEFKRTLTVFSENTAAGRKKFQEELEQIHVLFKEYLLKNRPQLDIKRISTGEHWLAMDAKALHLVDVIQTSDDYLMERLDKFNIYHIQSSEKPSVMTRVCKPVARWLSPFAFG